MSGVSPVIGFSGVELSVRQGRTSLRPVFAGKLRQGKQGELESSPRFMRLWSTANTIVLFQEIRAEKIKKQAGRLFYIVGRKLRPLAA